MAASAYTAQSSGVTVAGKPDAPENGDDAWNCRLSAVGLDACRRSSRPSAGEGAKGPRLYDWAGQIRPCTGPNWLLVRRSIALPGIQPHGLLT